MWFCTQSSFMLSLHVFILSLNIFFNIYIVENGKNYSPDIRIFAKNNFLHLIQLLNGYLDP